MRIFKNILGAIFVVCAIGFLAATEQVEAKMQPFFIALTLSCIISAVLLFRKSKKEKIHKVKNKSTTVKGQIVTIHTEHLLDDVPADIAKEMKKYYTIMQAQRDAEIMAESYRLASTTTNISTFCMRCDLALQKAHTLLQAEQVGVRGIAKLNCHNACISVIDTSPALKVRFLHDYAQEEIYRAEGLKTDKGKLNRYIKMLSALQNAETTFLSTDEYVSLLAKVKERVLTLGGAVCE